MKIIVNTPDTLVIGRRTLGCAIPAFLITLLFIWIMLLMTTLDEATLNKTIAVLFFAPFMLVAFAVGVMDAYQNRMTLNRATGTAELEFRNILRRDRRPFILGDIVRAEPTRAIANEIRKTTHKQGRDVSLILEGMDAGTYPVTRNRLSTAKAEALCDAINDWLAQ